ncbi:prolyl oligopeptidase family serine peptidase [Streptomyces sp. NPDC001851]|uniref:S9 family peptidase n=1 Tax=Streptomyces sp. NPDC001851 TaxID=3154529 RepID=UPI00332B4897
MPDSPETARTALPFGTWPSPITAAAVSAAMPAMSALHLDGTDLYWLERRPDSGRTVALRRTPDGRVTTLTGEGTDVRSSVYEYGGGALHAHGGVVHYVNGVDQRVHRLDDRDDRPLTPDHGPGTAHRYADLRVVPGAAGDVVCVRERHEDRGVVNDIVRLDGTGAAAPTVLVSGDDFYASPRPSPDGTMLAWLAWDHPDMPWTGSRLWLGRLGADGTVCDARPITGGHGESVFQPDWSPDGVLHFVTDRSGWWNLHRLGGAGSEPVLEMRAEFGWPQWTLDPSAYCFLEQGRIACLVIRDGVQRLGIIEPGPVAELRDLRLPYTGYQAIAGNRHGLYAIASAADRPQQLIRVDPVSYRHEILRTPGTALGAQWLQSPEPLGITGEDGRTVHGLFHPPRHPGHTGPAGALPPLILVCHGGPTTQLLPEYRPGIQFWTSRGFAVFELNYRGSSGWGRSYRAALDGRWGVADVEDCAAAARGMAALGLVDADRMVVRGGSAGGFTVLATLAESDIFAAGVSYFGICDLRLLRDNTHKFEKGSLEVLVGPWPEAAEEYRRRSPIERCDEISAPVLFLHGRQDRVVPPEQSALMAERLTERGVRSDTVFFDDEGHGFGRQASVVEALESELRFYTDVLQLRPMNAE